MMIEVLHLLVRANLAASPAIAAVAVLRSPARSAFGASAAYRLWAIPLVMAAASLVPAPRAALLAPVSLGSTSGLPAAASLASGSAPSAALASAWIAGALACATILGAEQLRFAAALRGARSASIGGTKVMRAPRADVGPAVVGRTIIVPSDFEVRFTPAEQAAVIAHEAQHLARGDTAVNAVVALLQCLCWFNPMVHLAGRWIRADQELACDAGVVAARPGLWRPYAEALLKTQRLVAVPPAGCGWRARGFAALRHRIRLLKQRAPSRLRRVCGALLAAALSLGGGYAAWAAQPAQRQAVVLPDWSSRPNIADVARLYPHKAVAERLGGIAVMQCRVGRTGALHGCTVVREAPQGAGFGQAALAMAPRFRMKPMSVNGKPVAGGMVRIPVKFALPPGRAGRR